MRLGFHFPSTLRVPQSNLASALRRPKANLAAQREHQVAAPVRAVHGVAPPASNMPSPWASIEEFVKAARMAGAL